MNALPQTLHIFENDQRCWCVPAVERHQVIDDETGMMFLRERWIHVEAGMVERGHRRRPRKPNPRVVNTLLV